VSDKIVEAIHDLELSLTDKIHLQTTALEVNSVELKALCVAVDRHRIILYGDNGEQAGLVSKMRAIEKAERERKWTLRGVTIAFFGLVTQFVYKVFNP